MHDYVMIGVGRILIYSVNRPICSFPIYKKKKRMKKGIGLLVMKEIIEREKILIQNFEKEIWFLLTQ